MKSVMIVLVLGTLVASCSNQQFEIIRENNFYEKYFHLNKLDTNRVQSFPDRKIYENIIVDFQDKSDSVMLIEYHGDGGSLVDDKYALYNYKEKAFYFLNILQQSSKHLRRDTTSDAIQVYNHLSAYIKDRNELLLALEKQKAFHGLHQPYIMISIMFFKSKNRVFIESYHFNGM